MSENTRAGYQGPVPGCRYLHAYMEGEPPEDGGATWMAFDCLLMEVEEAFECEHPGEPCPCKPLEMERDEWIQAMGERLRKARIFIAGGIIK